MNYLIAKRYAKALIQITQKESDWSQIETDLQVLAQAYSQGALRHFFEDPVFSLEERRLFADKLPISHDTQNLLKLLISKNRTFILPELLKAYGLEVDAKLGRVKAKITSAIPLPPQQLHDIAQALHQRLGQPIIPETIVKPSVLGGIQAQIGGLVFDGTLENQFSQLKRNLCN